MGFTWPLTGFWNHLIVSKHLLSHRRIREEIVLEPECNSTAVTRCEATRGLKNTTAVAPVWVDRWPIITWELLGHKSMVYYVPFIMSRVTFAWAGNIMIQFPQLLSLPSAACSACMWSSSKSWGQGRGASSQARQAHPEDTARFPLNSDLDKD